MKKSCSKCLVSLGRKRKLIKCVNGLMHERSGEVGKVKQYKTWIRGCSRQWPAAIQERSGCSVFHDSLTEQFFPPSHVVSLA